MAYLSKFVLFTGLMFCSLVFSACGQEAVENTRSDMAYVESENEAVNASIVEARLNLDHFWEAKASNDPVLSEFVLKVGLDTSDGGLEHIWMYDVSRDGGVYSGYLANVPQDIPGRKMDDKVTFKQDQISDWAYEKNGKLIGHYTTRALFPYMPKETVDIYKPMMGENP